MVSGHPSTQVTIEGSEKESWSMGLVMEETKEPSHRFEEDEIKEGVSTFRRRPESRYY